MNSYLLTTLPPTPPLTAELFTREWLNPILLDPFGSNGLEGVQPYKERTMTTQKKLIALHTRLEEYNSALFGNSVLGIQQTIEWMREKVGLWHIVSGGDNGGWLVKNVLMRKEDGNSLSLQLHWEGYVWGWERRENGLVFVMLNKTAVNWLNEVNGWCNEVELANEKEMI